MLAIPTHSARALCSAVLFLCASGLWPTPVLAEDPAADPMPSAEAEKPESAPSPPGPYGLEGGLDERFLAITKNALDRTGGVEVRDQSLSDAFATLSIIEGRIVPLRTEGGQTIGGWFLGTCSFSYRPPIGQETAAVERGTTLRRIDQLPCNEVLLLTDDEESLERLGLVPRDNEPPPPSNRETDGGTGPWLKHQLKRAEIYNLKGHSFGSFAKAALQRAAGAVPSESSLLRLVMRVDGLNHPRFHPKAEPLNTLYYSRHAQGPYAAHETHTLDAGHFGEQEDRYSVNLSSHPTEGVPESVYVAPNVDTVSAEIDLDIEVSTKPFATMDATATITLTTRAAPAEAVSLNLLRKMNFRKYGIREALGFDVKEVLDWKGRTLDFLHRGGDLLVRLYSPLHPGQAEVLTIRYSGNAMPRLTPDSFGLLANFAWWPQPGHHDRFTWKVRVCTPKAFRAAGTGTTLESKVEGGRRCERWDEPVPITFPAINMGRWVSGETTGPRGIKIRAFFLAEDETQLQPALKEAKRTLTFYEKLLGPYPYAELDIAQARKNMGFWQAPAGLLELSKMQGQVGKTAKKDLRSDYYPHVSVATLSHEVAHQWWGHVVGWKSYRDQWISETFAEYSSFLYTAQHFGEEVYLGRLEYWEQGARKSDPYGPMVLGFRIGGRAYQGQVYRRGPYFLHMLRRLAGDKALADFFHTLCEVAANRNLSTEDVQVLGEKVLGPDLRWMFEQWVHGTGLPDLEVDYGEVDGEIEVRIRQTQPEAPFRLVVPLVLKGKAKKPVVHLIGIEEREWTGRLPAPKGFKKLLLDPDRELLTGKKSVKERKSTSGASD